jgi:hypothetical protein
MRTKGIARYGTSFLRDWQGPIVHLDPLRIHDPINVVPVPTLPGELAVSVPLSLIFEWTHSYLSTHSSGIRHSNCGFLVGSQWKHNHHGPFLFCQSLLGRLGTFSSSYLIYRSGGTLRRSRNFKDKVRNRWSLWAVLLSVISSNTVSSRALPCPIFDLDFWALIILASGVPRCQVVSQTSSQRDRFVRISPLERYRRHLQSRQSSSYHSST